MQPMTSILKLFKHLLLMLILILLLKSLRKSDFPFFLSNLFNREIEECIIFKDREGWNHT